MFYLITVVEDYMKEFLAILFSISKKEKYFLFTSLTIKYIFKWEYI
jgi:hypothetical protein